MAPPLRQAGYNDGVWQWSCSWSSLGMYLLPTLQGICTLVLSSELILTVSFDNANI